MLRLIHTSRGRALVDFEHDPGVLGFGITLKTFDSEGWESSYAMWYERQSHRDGGTTLAGFLEAELQLPASEAASLAEEMAGGWIADWTSRGGDVRAEGTKYAVAGILIVGAVVVLLAVIAVGLIGWMLLT